MHDPLTLVIDINIPFTAKRDERGLLVRGPITIVSIWHVDPEKHGDDDSCDWFGGRRIPEEIRERIQETGRNEWKFYFGRDLGGDRRFSSDVEILFAVWSAIDWRVGKRRRRRTAAEIDEIFSLASNPSDNLSRSIQEAKRDPEGMAHLFYIVYSNYLRFHRPWWNHPRFHFWHYKIIFRPIQSLKRWAFSRCQGCGRRFSWGYSPTSTQWEGSGPLWFKSERNVYHSECVPTPMRVAVNSPTENL